MEVLRLARPSVMTAACCAALLAAACAPRMAAPIPSLHVGPCEAPAADTAGWRVVDHGEFVFRVPPDFERMPVQPFDSDVDQWGTSPHRFVMYDLGWYSNDLQEAARLAGYNSCTMHIGDHPAFVVAGWAAVGPKLVVAAAWRNLRGGGHLTLSATSDRRNEYGTLVSIVRSVRFKPR